MTGLFIAPIPRANHIPEYTPVGASAAGPKDFCGRLSLRKGGGKKIVRQENIRTNPFPSPGEERETTTESEPLPKDPSRGVCLPPSSQSRGFITWAA